MLNTLEYMSEGVDGSLHTREYWAKDIKNREKWTHKIKNWE